MPTVEEILRQSGFTNDQIRALEPRAITAFGGILSQAEQAREAAELAQRSNVDFYDNRIAPSLTQWEEEKVRLESERANVVAEAAFYRAQNEAARASGFVPAEAPGFQPRDGNGRYVAGGGSTPGSPAYIPGNGNGGVDMNAIDQRLGNGISNVAWAMQEYQRLNPGQFLPDSFDRLAQEATVQRMDFRDYVSRKYQFAEKRAEAAKKQQQEHDDKIRKEAEAGRDRFWSERVGSNPDVRRPEDSRFGSAMRAQKAGTIPDPLSLSEEQRRIATRAAIREDISKNSDA
jgi:hypothetical protein